MLETVITEIVISPVFIETIDRRHLLLRQREALQVEIRGDSVIAR